MSEPSASTTSYHLHTGSSTGSGQGSYRDDADRPPANGSPRLGSLPSPLSTVEDVDAEATRTSAASTASTVTAAALAASSKLLTAAEKEQALRNYYVIIREDGVTRTHELVCDPRLSRVTKLINCLACCCIFCCPCTKQISYDYSAARIEWLLQNQSSVTWEERTETHNTVIAKAAQAINLGSATPQAPPQASFTGNQQLVVADKTETKGDS